MIDLMRRFADAKGNMDYDRMDREEPNWRGIFHKDEQPWTHFSRLRNRGLFALHVNRTDEAPMPATPVISPAGLSDDEKIVIEISKKYITPDGEIDWKRAGQEHSDWQKRLSYPSNPKGNVKGHHIASRLRKRGLIPPSGQQVPVVAAVNTAAMRTEHLSEDKKLVLEIHAKYPRGDGQVDWKGAFAAHPEWRVRLTSPGATRPQKAYTLLDELRRKGFVPASHSPQSMAAKQRRQAENRNLPAVVNGAGPTPEELEAIEKRIKQDVAREVNRMMDAVLQECPHCPKCGRDNRSLFREALLLIKLNS